MKKIQFPHPGAQKHFSLKNGYREYNDKIIREWNKDKSHYRKFILNQGDYLNDLNDSQPKSAGLYFWGEWEGNSVFESLKNEDYRIMPNGVHKPFHSTEIREHQNTDPYVFGDYLKYCVCKQSYYNKKKESRLPTKLPFLDKHSVILFGTNNINIPKFYIDTVFVVKCSEHSSKVIENNGANYTKVYREETLEQLQEYFKPEVTPSENKIFHGQTWWDNSEFFSFVPCKTDMGENGFERMYLDWDDPLFQPSKTTQAITYFKSCDNLSQKKFWQKIVEKALEQGFKLGIRFEEPEEKKLENLV